MFISQERTLAPKIKRARDKESPYFRPLVEWKKPCMATLTIIEYQLLDIILQVILMNIFPKPILLNTK